MREVDSCGCSSDCSYCQCPPPCSGPTPPQLDTGRKTLAINIYILIYVRTIQRVGDPNVLYCAAIVHLHEVHEVFTEINTVTEGKYCKLDLSRTFFNLPDAVRSITFAVQ